MYMYVRSLSQGVTLIKVPHHSLRAQTQDRVGRGGGK